MKKLIAMILVLAMVVAMAACGKAKSMPGTMEENTLKVMEIAPVEFMGGCIPVDLTDADSVSYYTGLSSADAITAAAVYEPMMGSIAFSMVAVEVAEGTDPLAVAEDMKSGIDTRKWICVEANDLLVAVTGPIVLLIMVDSNNGMTAQSFVDAFQSVVGVELDAVI